MTETSVPPLRGSAALHSSRSTETSVPPLRGSAALRSSRSTETSVPPLRGSAALRSSRSTETPAAVRAAKLSKVYGKGDAQVVALDEVTVEFRRGQLTAIMGPSGSGKSTLMHCVAGLDTPTSGEAWVGEVELSQLSDDKLTELRRDRIGFVFQAFNLLPTLTAWENITLPLDLAGRKVDKAFADAVIDAVGLRDRLTHRPSQLSGGQQQRVACARALIAKPDVIFADEPTGALDSKTSAEVLGFLRRSVDELGQTVVMVTHEPTAAAYADRVLHLADGRIVDDVRAN